MKTRSLTKLPHTTSLTPIKKNAVANNIDQEKQFNIISQRKEIEGTLRQLHKLQSQIYELNVSDQPHSSSPVKKQIKQLSYLYENMVKPKTKNSLDIKSQDIEIALRILNKNLDADTKLQKQIAEQQSSTLLAMQSTMKTTKNNFNKAKKIEKDHSYKIPKDTLKYKFSQLTHEDLNYNFITHNQESANQSQDEISVKQLYDFINYTDCDNFDPIEEAYNMFTDENGKFDKKIYNQYSQVLGLPPIKSWNTFLSAVHQVKDQVPSDDLSTITLKQFRHIFTLQK